LGLWYVGVHAALIFHIFLSVLVVWYESNTPVLAQYYHSNTTQY
jgi:hypothetical protein